MMKKTQLTDALRNIKKERVSYLSILLVAFMAVTCYVGVVSGKSSFLRMGNDYYDRTNLHDIEVISTLLLEPDDLDAIRALQGVADVEGIYQIAAKVSDGKSKTDVVVQSLTERVNTPIVTEGRLPAAANECAVEKRLLGSVPLAVGDSVRVTDSAGGVPEYLADSEYVVTGIVLHPDHLFDIVRGDPFVLVTADAFSTEALDGCFMRAEVLIDKPAGTDRCGEAYKESAEAVRQELDALSAERAALRDASIHGRYQNEIDLNQEKLDEAARELADARAQLDEGAAAIEENRQRLADAARTLEDSLRALESGELELSDAKALLERTGGQLADAEAQLADGKRVLDETARELADAEAQLADGKRVLDETAAQLADAERELADAEAQLAEGKALLDEKKTELADARAQLDAAAQELADGKAELERGAAELKQAEKELADAEQQLADAKRQLDSANWELIDAKRQLRDAERRLADAEGQIEDAKQQIAAAEAELLAAHRQIEDAKTQIRDKVRETLRAALIGRLALQPAAADAVIEAIPWAESDYSPDFDDPKLDARWFRLTNDIGVRLPDTYQDVVDGVMGTFDGLYDALLYAMESLDMDTAATAARREEERAELLAALTGDPSLAAKYDGAIAQFDRWNEAYAQYQDGKRKLADAEKEYEDGLAKYKKGQFLYDNGLAQYNQGMAEYEAGRAAYEEGKAQYEAGLAAYEDATAQYEDGKARYEDGEAQYADGVRQYEDGVAQYEDGVAQYEDGLARYNDGKAQYEEGLAQYEEGLAQYNDGKAQYDEGVALYNENLAKFEDATARYNKGLADYQRGQRQYEDGLNAYESGLAQYEDGARQLAEGERELAEGEREYAEGAARYADGAAQLDAARRTLDELDPARWILLDASANGGYVQLNTSGRSIEAIGNRFTLMFLLLAALVIYATVGKLVNEQHKLVGMTKAFGFYNREIVTKYLFYGISATAGGVVLGTLASIPLQLFIAGGFAKGCVVNSTPIVVRYDVILPVLAAGALLAGAAVWAASAGLMRSTAIELMKDSAPAGVKKGGSGGSVLTLYQRLILRNMRSDRLRIFITVVSVAGCCMLMVIGFTMRGAFLKTPERQFGDIVHYDFDVSFDPDADGTVQRALQETLQSRGASAAPAYRFLTAATVSGHTDFVEITVMDSERIGELFSLIDPDTGRELSVGDDGVYVISGIRAAHGVTVGDSIVLMDAAGTKAAAQIAGVYRSYVGQFLFLTPTYYEKLFGTAPEPNYLMGCRNGAAPDELSDALSAVDGFDKLEGSDQQRLLFDNFSGVVLALVGLLTVVAGLMAAVILTNLTNIYLRQKKRELAVMRVNGFTVRETIRYVLRETYITTALGIVLGCIGGSAMGIWVVSAFQSSFFRFITEPDLAGCLISGAITVLFTVVINAVTLRQVRNLKLTDAAS